MAKHITGKKGPHIMLYAISTCPMCKKAKQLLSESGMEYYYEDADQLTDSARRDLIADLERWNPKRSFPTTVFNNNRCVIGFLEQELRILLKA